MALVLSLASQANASLIEIDGNQANPLELSESFRSFYSFADGTPWSANTGYEKANTLTAFLATYMDDTALFLIFSGPGGDAGAANFDIVGSEGGISYIDDPVRREKNGKITPRDPIVGNNVSMTYSAGFTDGLIFSGLMSDDWSIDINFNSTSSIDSYRFLTFDEQGDDSVLFSFDGAPENFNVKTAQVVVSAPFVSILMMFGFAYLLYRRT